MIVSSILNSPRIYNGYSNVNITAPFKNSYLRQNNNISSDTVSFTGEIPAKIVNETVSLAFEKLNKTKPSGIFRKYLGVTKNNVNVLIQETSLGKEAVLAFTNGDFDNKTFAMYELHKTKNKSSEIISLLDDKLQMDISSVKMIKTLLEDLK